MNLKLIRVSYTDPCTYGVLIGENSVPLCVTAERPWLDNKRDVSCIPTGVYSWRRKISPSKNKSVGGEVIEFIDVPGRSYIYIHIGNVPAIDSKGCVLVGTGYGTQGVYESTIAMRYLLKELPETGTIWVE